jgi:hypothetical protein
MTINEHMTEFAGKRVVLWEPGEALPDPEGAICRIAVSWEESEDGVKWVGKFEQFLADPASREVTGLVVGMWAIDYDAGVEDSESLVAAIAAASGQLPQLTALFFGDIIVEENEISWIKQTDVSPLLVAYPQLEQFGVRGGDSLTFGELRHERLQTLIVETGGLPASVAREVVVAELPELRHLELWLGMEHYGGDTTIADLTPILSGEQFLKLEYLGLRDSQEADEVATAVATAPILERIDVLDLSLGTLTDAGAAALAASPAVARLRKLDIHYHFCSAEGLGLLQALPIELDASDPQETRYDGDEVYRYAAVTE